MQGRDPAHAQRPGRGPAGRAAQCPEGGAVPDTPDGSSGHDAAQTVSRRRPLSRLARRIALPPLVDIRLRNPWVLARLRVFGWYVRFTSDRPFVVPPTALRRRSGCRCQPGKPVAGQRNRSSDARRDSRIATSRCRRNGVRSNDQVVTCVPHLWTRLWMVVPGGVRRSRWNKAMGCGRAALRP
jgi:hypothetical protein